MYFKDLFKTAMSSITSNKLQAILSMLGVIIGICSVVTIMTISEGAKKNIESQLEDFGTNVIQAGVYDLEKKGFKLEVDEIRKLSNSKYIDYTSIETNSVYSDVFYGETSSSVSFIGVDEFYKDFKNYKINGGRFINAADVETSRNFVVIGSVVASNLFGTQNPIGETISAVMGSYVGDTYVKSHINLQVIGVLEKSETEGYYSPNEKIYMPYTSFGTLFGQKIESFNIVASDTDTIANAKADAEIFLKGLIYPYIADEYNGTVSFDGFDETYYDDEVYLESAIDTSIEEIPTNSTFIGYWESSPVENYYYIYENAEFVNQSTELIGTVTLLIAAIAGISLFVGGIGIANVMFMSVLERTKEIGLRKAVGAKNKDIVKQFLIESVLITCVGGTIGLMLGVILSIIVSVFAEEIDTAFSLNVMIGSFGVSVLTGVLAGYFPARKASRLNPIDALRYE